MKNVSIYGFSKSSKTGKSKSDFKMKNMIGDGMKMFRKYQLAIWLSIQNFCSHFTKVTHKCECFLEFSFLQFFQKELAPCTAEI
jgi:hypothetical protein